MGMNWDEVHDDAEQMEHVVSDRLIERIDEMLGRPEFDPHGPLNTPVTVARVTDQDAAFLRFLESQNLKPGQTIEVEGRDEVSDSVRLKGSNDQRMTIGTRAASKLLVTE
jgi:DtxR family Mn-dependent transcriptional regulator